jgi:nudix-type nucleoside diphosphatase (YffH/AdpP family)
MFSASNADAEHRVTRKTMSAEILEKKTVHDGWAKYSVLRVRLPDGQSAKRELEEHGPAVAVLPYDAERRTALLVCQFRAPVLAAAGEVTLMEAIAGLTDGEAPDQAARREALEETGVRLEALEPVGTVWTMPGLSTERMHLYLAPYTRGDRLGEGGGAHGEHENITVLELPLRQLAAMADSGALADMKTLALVQTLRLRHPELFMAGQPRL